MDEQKLTHKPHGAQLVKAMPGRYRERALNHYNPPLEMARAPEGETRERTAKGMDEATKRMRDEL